MLILTLGGGLGNQMFQYGYARYLQRMLGEQLIYINDSEVIKEKDRFYALNNLNVTDVKMLSRLFSKPLNEIERAIRKMAVRVLRRPEKSEEELFVQLNKIGIYYHPSVYRYFESKQSMFPIKVIEGGFQSWKYIDDEIKNELMVKTMPSIHNREMLEIIADSEAVCVHIRRGDYLLPKYKNLNVCTKDYYLEAMNYIIDNIDNPVFFIFSNSAEDLDWIRDNYNLPGKIVYVKNDNPDYEELRLMYSCKHFIISNSTFSWWAQFLSKRREIVIAPSMWNRIERKGIADLYMPDWVTINVN